MTEASAVEGAQSNPFVGFLLKYKHDSVLFVREVLGIEPEPYQVRILEAYDRNERRQSIRSGHGVGKTAVLAWMIVHAMVFRYPCKIACTAPTGGQLFDALAAEVKTWLKKLPDPLVALFEIKSERIELIAAKEEVFVSFRTSSVEKPEALAGIHSDAGWVLLIVDEASGVPDAIFEAASGSMSGHNAMTIMAGNPVRSTGLFYDTHNTLDNWVRTHISCIDSKRVSRDFIEDMKARYGELSNAFRVRVLGLFPLADDDAVFPRELTEPALDRDVKAINVRTIWGLDPAGKGRDLCALAKRQGNVLTEPVKSWSGLDTMEIAGRVLDEWRQTPHDLRPTDINIDAIGFGAGTADRLRELGLPARAINVSELPSLTERYRNLRAELAFKARQWFANRDVNIAGDKRLVDELAAITYDIPESNGKIILTPKKKLPKSPDHADALILTFASEAVSASLGSESQNYNWKKPLKRNLAIA